MHPVLAQRHNNKTQQKDTTKDTTKRHNKRHNKRQKAITHRFINAIAHDFVESIAQYMNGMGVLGSLGVMSCVP
jgi:hypothetical protein